MGKFSDVKEATGNAGHYLTDLCIIEIGVGLLLQMVKEVLSHISLDLCAHYVPHVQAYFDSNTRIINLGRAAILLYRDGCCTSRYNHSSPCFL